MAPNQTNPSTPAVVTANIDAVAPAPVRDPFQHYVERPRPRHVRIGNGYRLVYDEPKPRSVVAPFYRPRESREERVARYKSEARVRWAKEKEEKVRLAEENVRKAEEDLRIAAEKHEAYIIQRLAEAREIPAGQKKKSAKKIFLPVKLTF